MTDEPRAARQLTRLVGEFERNRPYLRAVAYRMLGSLVEADDALQEGWLRLHRQTPDESGDLRPWSPRSFAGSASTSCGRGDPGARTTAGPGCRSRSSARRPRPQSAPEDEAVLADSVGLAMLVVLETLSPAERLAFVLHDVFALPFDEVAPVVDRSPDATRQLASRARRRMRGSADQARRRPRRRTAHRRRLPASRSRGRLRGATRGARSGRGAPPRRWRALGHRPPVVGCRNGRTQVRGAAPFAP